MWNLKEYVNSGGNGVVSKWVRKELSQNAKDDFHDLLNYLRNTQRGLWVMPDYRVLVNVDLGEIRWKSDNKEYRVFGFFRPEEMEYVMVLGAYHKQRVYTPADAINTAESRKDDIEKKYNGVQEYK